MRPQITPSVTFIYEATGQQKILRYTGIPTSIGIGSTKTLAKVSLTKFFDALTPVFYHIN